VARDRKRAKQRRIRGGGAAARRRAAANGATDAAADANGAGDVDAAEAGASHPGSIERADVPGALDHASAEVDEFDAALIRGAGGVEAPDPISDSPERLSEEEIEQEAEDEGDLSEDAVQELSGPAGSAHAATPEQASGAPIRKGNRAIGFLRASWAELQRVQWPDRRQVTQATAVVLGFVAIAGLYLGLADYVAKEFVELIL
jgi:preprotein translocase subunit SecE